MRGPPQFAQRESIMKKHLLSTVAYIVGTFAVQATSHFVVNREHYASVTLMAVEGVVGLIQFSLFGILAGWIHAKFDTTATNEQ